jgi:predicted ATPase
MTKLKTLKPPFLKKTDYESVKESKNQFPFTLPIFKKSFELSFKRSVTIFVGENGSGKSTFLEFIAFLCGFNLQGGSSDHRYQTQGRECSTHLLALKD